MVNGSPLRPIRNCRKSTGPLEESFIAIAETTRTGESAISPAHATETSTVRFTILAERLSAGGATSIIGSPQKSSTCDRQESSSK